METWRSSRPTGTRRRVHSNTPRCVSVSSSRISRAIGMKTVAVMCGQGLVDHVDLVRDRLEQGGAHEYMGKTFNMHPPYKDLIVYPANSTAASEDSGIPVPLMPSAISRRATAARWP
mmetsp:Transcript_67509/g.166771  ORF Transcript_67509/g.166771 Transcript_67509/m.166771 type:complete len:117 (+) Transcript_67509:804-1154(+)